MVTDSTKTTYYGDNNETDTAFRALSKMLIMTSSGANGMSTNIAQLASGAGDPRR